MSRRKKYRKGVATGTAHPDDGDHYAITVQPPLNRDDEYCRITVNGRTWGKGGRAVESRSAAIDYLQDTVDGLDRKARDDKDRGSLPRYPDPPKPANTRFRVHPDFEDEIGARELWGNATLASFGADSGSKYAEAPWYQHRETYRKWLAPLRDAQGGRALRVLARDPNWMTCFWYVVHEDQLCVATCRPNGHKQSVGESQWTSATRRVGGIGITNAPPADIRTLDVDETPFANGLSEESVLVWLDEHEPELLDKSEANQIDQDGDHERREEVAP